MNEVCYPSTLAMLQLMVEWGFVPGPSFFESAASEGHFEQIKWAKSQGYEWGSGTCTYAAVAGRLDILQWAKEHGCPCNDLCCDNAAKIGNMEILQWARKHNCPWSKNTIEAAATNGHFEIIQWLVDNGCPLPSTITFSTEKSIYEYLLNRGCTIDISAIHAAATEGHMETVKWLLQYVSPSNAQESSHICKMAANHGDINMLTCARQNGYDWNEQTINYAVHHPHVFKWLRNNGCPWNSSTLEEIVANEDDKLLKWALKRKCPVNASICEIAAGYGNIELMKVLLQFYCQFNPNEIAAAAIDAYNNRLFYWLVKNDIVIMTKDLYVMAEENQEITDWLVRRNCPKE